jgi:hypothetical protein
MNQTKTPEQIALQIFALFQKLSPSDRDRLLSELINLFDGPEAA